MIWREKLQRLAVQTCGVLFTQVGIQGIGAITGLMLVRTMPKDEYAWLTICGSLLATLGILSDGGIATAITSMSGRVSRDKTALAQVADACLAVRNRLSLFSLALTLPPFFILFTRMEMSSVMTALILSTAALTLWPVTSSKFLPVTLRIAGNLKSTQIIEFGSSMLRCGATAIVLLVGWRQVYPTFLATLSAIWLHAWLARRAVGRAVGTGSGTPAQRSEVWGFVRALYANHIFFCVQGQIATWIISFTSSVAEIADVGALSRLTIFFAIFTAVFHYLVLPKVAVCQSPLVLRSIFIFAASGTLGTVLSLTVVTWLIPTPFLWILGGSYSHLTFELPVAFAAHGLGAMTGMMWVFMQVRGWVRLSWLNIPLTLVGYVVGVLVSDLSTVAGVLLMTGVSNLPSLLWGLGYTWMNLNRDVSRMSQPPSSE